MADILKILMVQTSNLNLGDTILADNDYYLLKKALRPRRCEILRYSISSRDVGQVKYVDAVVFAGGILKCTNESFHLYIPEIINEANRYNVPVFMSAIGVEKYYDDNEGSKAVKEAINLPCVKGISVRDDIETLKRDYLTNKSITTYSVYDPAVWCKKTYRKELKIKRKKEQFVGLGITREKLFADYGNPQIDKQFQLDFWKGIIDELEKRNIKWEVFTNGDRYDEIFAGEVLRYAGKKSKAPTPRTGVSVVKTISKYTSVIAGRMHSNIVSFSLKIPSIGFIWNQKLRFWGEKIGYPERFIECKDLTVENVITAWEKAKEEGCVLKRSYKTGVYKALKDFAKNYCHIREKEHENLDFKKHMLAPSLGGIDTRYRNTNSPQAFEHSLNHGFRNFLCDVRLTKDDVAVCVNKWHKDTYKMLNHRLATAEKALPVSYDEFMKCKYYHRFNTLSLEQLFDLCHEHINSSDINMVLAVGRPNKEDFEKLLDQIKEQISKHSINTKNLFFRLEQKRDIDTFKKSSVKMNIIYHLVLKKMPEEETLKAFEEALSYCKDKKIKYIYFKLEMFTEEYAQLCEKYGVKFYTSPYVKTEKVIDCIKNGAHFVTSHYYEVDYLRKLTK